MTMRIVRLTPELLDLVIAHQRDPEMAPFIDTPHYRGRVLSQSYAYALIDGGYVVGAGGIVAHWHGRAEGWWLMSVFARPRHLAFFTRFTGEIALLAQQDPAFARLEMMVRASSTWRESFVRAIGFKWESTLRGWGPDGGDWVMYARFDDNQVLAGNQALAGGNAHG